jgi:hypothetical protein
MLDRVGVNGIVVGKNVEKKNMGSEEKNGRAENDEDVLHMDRDLLQRRQLCPNSRCQCQSEESLATMITLGKCFRFCGNDWNCAWSAIQSSQRV